MALAAVLLAWTMYWVDSLVPNEALQNSRFVLSGTVAELRSALLNMAGTILATAGVVFTLLSAAFDMLRHASCDNASVLLHMLETIDVMGQETKAPEARRQLLRHVSLIQAESQAGALIEQDRHLIERSSAALQLKLAGA
jgi:hypothetical protein